MDSFIQKSNLPRTISVRPFLTSWLGVTDGAANGARYVDGDGKARHTYQGGNYSYHYSYGYNHDAGTGCRCCRSRSALSGGDAGEECFVDLVLVPIGNIPFSRPSPSSITIFSVQLIPLLASFCQIKTRLGVHWVLQGSNNWLARSDVLAPNVAI